MTCMRRQGVNCSQSLTRAMLPSSCCLMIIQKSMSQLTQRIIQVQPARVWSGIQTRQFSNDKGHSITGNTAQTKPYCNSQTTPPSSVEFPVNRITGNSTELAGVVRESFVRAAWFLVVVNRIMECTPFQGSQLSQSDSVLPESGWVCVPKTSGLCAS